MIMCCACWKKKDHHLIRYLRSLTLVIPLTSDQFTYCICSSWIFLCLNSRVFIVIRQHFSFKRCSAVEISTFLDNYNINYRFETKKKQRSTVYISPSGSIFSWFVRSLNRYYATSSLP